MRQYAEKLADGEMSDDDVYRIALERIRREDESPDPDPPRTTERLRPLGSITLDEGESMFTDGADLAGYFVSHNVEEIPEIQGDQHPARSYLVTGTRRIYAFWRVGAGSGDLGTSPEHFID